MSIEDLIPYIQTNSNNLVHTTTDDLDPPEGVICDTPQTRRRYIAYLTHAAAAIESQRGDDTTFHVAFEGKLYGLPPEITTSLMSIYYNPKCEPPWSEEELEQKVHNAYDYTDAPIGAVSGVHAFDSVPVDIAYTEADILAEQEAKNIKWDFVKPTDPKSEYKNTLANTVNFFLLSIRHDRSTGTYGPNELHRLLRFNEFSNQIEFTRPAPWHYPQNAPVPIWTDADVIQCRIWLAHKQYVQISTPMMQDAAIAVAKQYAYHPVRQYLKALTWDGECRIDGWLATYCGANDTAYARTIGKCVLVGAVARVMEPGCQYDSMLVLEGKEGTGKTSAIRILGGEWYADVIIDPHEKDTISSMQGSWILEASELEFARRIEAQAMKRFLTLNTDKVRLPYGRNSIELPRQSIFIGSVNPGSKPAYLSDIEGNRRFWPILTRRIKLDQLTQDRDQLFAEAFQRFNDGEDWHLSDPNIIRTASDETLYRVGIDAWQENIEAWLTAELPDDAPSMLTTTYIASGALNILPRELDRLSTSRICRCLENIGYERYQKWNPENKVKYWAWRKVEDGLLEDM